MFIASTFRRGPRLSYLRRVSQASALALVVCALTAVLGVATAAAAPRAAAIIVVGQNDPNQDVVNVQSAINRAYLKVNGTVEMRGTFDFGSCSVCVIIPGPMTITGTGNPTVANPSVDKTTTIKTTGAAPMAILDTGPATGKITIRRIWFNGAQTLAIMMLQVVGRLDVLENRITNVHPGKEFRFAIAGASVGTSTPEAAPATKKAIKSLGNSGGPQMTGIVNVDGNYINSSNVPMQSGDDNALAFAGCHLKAIKITNNVMYAGEAVEIEGCRGKNAIYLIARNTIVQTNVVSNLAQQTKTPGFKRHGGHPVAIKPIDVEATKIFILGNDIDSRQAPRSAVCIMTGDRNPASKTVIAGNLCEMNGQFAAVLGGWAGTPGFFQPFFMQNTTIIRNIFLGKALLGIGLMDFTYLNNAGMMLTNTGHANSVHDNYGSGFLGVKAAVFLGPNTAGNTIVNNMRGGVMDQGTGNTVTTK